VPVLKLHADTPRELVHRWRGSLCTIGCAAICDLHVDVETVNSFHAKIERRGSVFWLVDLSSTNGSFVNGRKVTECALQSGDDVQLGEVVHARFEIEPADVVVVEPAPAVSAMPLSPSETLQPMGSGAIVPQGAPCPGCHAFIPSSVNFCPRCGWNVMQTNLPALPMGGMPMGGYVRPMEPPGGSVGMLPLLALLCGLSAIGFPFAIVLGLLALSQIRKFGGFASDRRQAVWGTCLGVFWAVAFLVAGGWYGTYRYWNGREDYRAKRIAQNEAQVVADLKGIARAQRLAKLIWIKDPQGTGTGQYLELSELTRVRGTFFNRKLASGRDHEYVFSIREPNETGYLALAEPKQYGVTGKRTFAVDPTGVVRAQDLEGQSYEQSQAPLSTIAEAKSAFDDNMDDAIAKEGIAYAKQFANEGKYELSRQILDQIPEQFALTSAAQELTAVRKSVDPFIIEAQAQNRYQKSQKAMAEGDLQRAIGFLKEITELYPSYSRIAIVTEELGRHQTAFAQKVDKEAKAIFEQAEALEREGKPEAALDLYVQIEKNYPSTDWAQRMNELRPAIQKSIREKSAEQLFAQVRDLSVTNDYRNIINLVEQLQRGYADTDYLSQNKESVDALYHRALSQYYRGLAVDQMNSGRDADALARLEEAIGKDADLRPVLRDLFLKLYLRVGRRRMDEGNSREALRLYRNYLSLDPETREVSPAVLSQLHFGVAKAEFAQGNYAAAAKNLTSAGNTFTNNSEFNDLFGSVHIALGTYEESLPYFDRAIAAKPTSGNFFARRGYAQILLALQIEQEAMTAFAGLLKEPKEPPAGSDVATTNATAPTEATAEAAPAEPDASTSADGDPFAPTFATTLPPTASGLKPTLRIRYDALASQTLLDNLLEFMEQSYTTNTTAEVSRSSSSKRRSSGKSSGSDSSNATTSNNTSNATSTSTSSITSATRDRIRRLRTGVGLGHSISSLHQKLLDNNTRKTKAVDTLRRMGLLFADGNRDLSRALSLSADRPAELTEILKTTQQHEQKLAAAVPRIRSYLLTEIDVTERAYQATDSLYRSVRSQRLGAAFDPTAMLDVFFSRLMDQSQFDEGIQALREAGAIKVPLDSYSILPVGLTAPTSTAAAKTTTAAPVTAE